MAGCDFTQNTFTVVTGQKWVVEDDSLVTGCVWHTVWHPACNSVLCVMGFAHHLRYIWVDKWHVLGLVVWESARSHANFLPPRLNITDIDLHVHKVGFSCNGYIYVRVSSSNKYEMFIFSNIQVSVSWAKTTLILLLSTPFLYAEIQA